MVIEVQLRPDADKRFSWPAYVTNARARHQCDATLVVVTPYKYVAAWARKPISLGPGSGHVQPLVFGPNEVPAIVDGAQARQNPELAVLSAITHGRDRNFAQAANIATQAIAAAMSMPDGNGQVYYDWILAALSHSARKALRMIPQNYEYKDAGLRRAKNEGEAKGKPRAKPRVRPRAKPRVRPRAKPRVRPRAKPRVRPRANFWDLETRFSRSCRRVP